MAQVNLTENQQAEKTYNPITLDTDSSVRVTMKRSVSDKGMVLRCAAVRQDGEAMTEVGNAVYNEERDHASVSVNTLKGLSRETVLEALETMVDAMKLMKEEIEK